jgi:hypothetical protein
MELLKELIDKTSSEDCNLNNVLIKAKLLAHALDSSDFRSWVDSEINGYKSGSDLPAYRILPSSVQGHISNGYYTAQDYPLPIMHLEKKMSEALQTLRIGQSVSALEDFISSGDKNLTWAKIIPPELHRDLSKGLAQGFVVQYAYASVGKGQIVQLLTEIRSKLLDFLLALSDKMAIGISIDDLKKPEEKKSIEGMFHTSIYGDNATIFIGQSSENIAIANIHEKDFPSLADSLRTNKVDEPDIIDLKEIIDTDTPDVKTKKFGPKVGAWIKKMVSKAASSSWQISLEGAGNLLANAIWKYYGAG